MVMSEELATDRDKYKKVGEFTLCNQHSIFFWPDTIPEIQRLHSLVSSILDSSGSKDGEKD